MYSNNMIDLIDIRYNDNAAKFIDIKLLQRQNKWDNIYYTFFLSFSAWHLQELYLFLEDYIACFVFPECKYASNVNAFCITVKTIMKTINCLIEEF